MEKERPELLISPDGSDVHQDDSHVSHENLHGNRSMILHLIGLHSETVQC